MLRSLGSRKKACSINLIHFYIIKLGIEPESVDCRYRCSFLSVRIYIKQWKSGLFLDFLDGDDVAEGGDHLPGLLLLLDISRDINQPDVESPFEFDPDIVFRNKIPFLELLKDNEVAETGMVKPGYSLQLR